MTRAFLPVKHLEKAFMEVHEGDDQFINKIKTLQANPVARTYVNLIRFLDKDVSKLMHVIRVNDGSMLVPPLLFKVHARMINPNNPDQIEVFQNLPCDFNIGTDANFVHLYTCGYKLPDLLESIAAEPKHASFYPYRRGIKRINTRRVISLTKFLTNYVIDTQENERLASHYVRDLAEAICNAFKPVQLHYAEKPEEFSFMYENGPSSCMTGHKERAWSMLKKKYNYVPTSFFAWHPHTRGCYVVAKKGNEKYVTARCILYENGNDKAFGRVYSTSQRARDQMISTLIKEGYKTLDGNKFKWRAPASFTVPGFYDSSTNDYIMPFPYLDNLPNNIIIKFDEDQKQFTVNIKEKSASNVAYQSTNGIVRASEINNTRCAHCGDRLAPGRGVYTIDNAAFCTADHAKNQGYVFAYRNDATGIWDLKENVVQDAIDKQHFYTTEDAAVALGAVPFVDSPDNIPEIPTYTRFGTTILINGKPYKMNDNRFHELAKRPVNNLLRIGKLKLSDFQSLTRIQRQRAIPDFYITDVADVNDALNRLELPEAWTNGIYAAPAYQAFDPNLVGSALDMEAESVVSETSTVKINFI